MKWRGTPFPPCPPGFDDHIYKKIAGLDIPLRVWKAQGNVVRAPWVLWTHGGGWIAGKYTAPNAWVVPGFTSRGYHVVSVAYRFLPQVKLRDIIDDCKDAFEWCRMNLGPILGEKAIDVNRYITAGDSAGGYLASQLVFELSPPPSAVVPVYAVTDLISQSSTRKKVADTPATGMPQYHRPRSVEELEAAANDNDPANAQLFCPWDGDLPPAIAIETTREFVGVADFEPTDAHWLRLDLNKYLVSKSFDLIRSLFVHTQDRTESSNDDKMIDALKEASPYYEVDRPSIRYPPTFFMHGQKDSLVSVQQATAMEAKLRDKGIPTGHCFDEEGEHCYEIFISGPHEEDWDGLITPALDFVDKYVKGVQGVSSW